MLHVVVVVVARPSHCHLARPPPGLSGVPETLLPLGGPPRVLHVVIMIVG